jgi:hypothetical protein
MGGMQMFRSRIIHMSSFSLLLVGSIVPPAFGLPLDRMAESDKPFRYIILSNSVDDEKTPELAERRVSVLLDDESFSEETLKKLFRLLAKRFPKPEWMVITVHTSLKQVPTPEEEDLGSVSEADQQPDYFNYHWAVLIRDKDNELFRYNPNPSVREIKTVIMRGRDPYNTRK